jgi:hypothetical protein
MPWGQILPASLMPGKLRGSHVSIQSLTLCPVFLASALGNKGKKVSMARDYQKHLCRQTNLGLLVLVGTKETTHHGRLEYFSKWVLERAYYKI